MSSRPRPFMHPLEMLRRIQRVTLLWLAALALLPGGVLAQQAVDLSALDAYFAQAQRDWPVPGFAVAIVKDGRIVFEQGYGARDARERGEVDEHTLFAIASNTKAFTAASLGVLVDEGALSWNDRVVEHLPYFQLYDPYVTQEMRIRDLLSHRSGLGTYSGDLPWFGTSYSAEEVVRRARFVPQAYPFRAGYGYSNLMFITAGEIIQAITGMTWAEFDRNHFFQPLGMSRTVTSTDALGAMENVATPHKNDRGEVIPIEWYNWDAMGAGGGIISSVHDMSQWLLLQLEGGTRGGREYFSEDAQREMWTQYNAMAVSPESQCSYPSTHFRGYGLGWNLMDYLGRKVMSHGGGYDGMFSRVVLVPEEELGMVILTNSMTGISTSLSYRILDAYLGGEEQDWSAQGLEGFQAGRQRFEARQDEAEEGRVSGTRPSLALSEYGGTYGGAMYGDAAVSLEDGRLVLRLLPNPDLVADLTHLHYDTFLLEWRTTLAWFGRGTVQFLMDTLGEIVEMKMDVPNEDFWFHELELKRRER